MHNHIYVYINLKYSFFMKQSNYDYDNCNKAPRYPNKFEVSILSVK